MIRWFQNEKEANDWMQANREWTMLCVAAGSISGSLMVGFVATPISAPLDVMREMVKQANDDLNRASGLFNLPSPKRRGRPPKVKNA